MNVTSGHDFADAVDSSFSPSVFKDKVIYFHFDKKVAICFWCDIIIYMYCNKNIHENKTSETISKGHDSVALPPYSTIEKISQQVFGHNGDKAKTHPNTTKASSRY